MDRLELTQNVKELIFALEKISQVDAINLKELGIRISNALKSGKGIYWCGNGGSAAESQHMAAELMGRFMVSRKPYKSLSLTTDTSAITGIANDFDFEEIFSRQLEGISSPGDYLIVFSTSGNSKNIINVLKKAREIGVNSAAFLGHDGGHALGLSDTEFFIQSRETARIQEVHTILAHTLCQIIESESEK